MWDGGKRGAKKERGGGVWSGKKDAKPTELDTNLKKRKKEIKTVGPWCGEQEKRGGSKYKQTQLRGKKGSRVQKRLPEGKIKPSFGCRCGKFWTQEKEEHNLDLRDRPGEFSQSLGVKEGKKKWK